MEIVDRIVDFETHCKTCRFKDTPENEDPCEECLDEPINQNTDKPINWEVNKK